MGTELNTPKSDRNLIRHLRQQAEHAWREQMTKCTREKVWTTLNAGIYDIHMMGISWKLKWIEQELDRIAAASNTP